MSHLFRNVIKSMSKSKHRKKLTILQKFSTPKPIPINRKRFYTNVPIQKPIYYMDTNVQYDTYKFTHITCRSETNDFFIKLNVPGIKIRTWYLKCPKCPYTQPDRDRILKQRSINEYTRKIYRSGTQVEDFSNFPGTQVWSEPLPVDNVWEIVS